MLTLPSLLPKSQLNTLISAFSRTVVVIVVCVLAEAVEPHAVPLRAPGHADEVASAGGPRGGRVSDRCGGQRAAGGPDGGGPESLSQNTAQDG